MRTQTIPLLTLLILPVACSEKPEVPGTTAEPSVASRDEGHEQMLAWLRDIRDQTPGENRYLGNKRVLDGRASLAALAADEPLPSRVQQMLTLGSSEMEYGNEREAIAVLQAAHDLLAQARSKGQHEELDLQVSFRLGVAFMRLGETANCVALNSPSCCIIPFDAAATHTQTEGSERASEYFTEVLERTSADTMLHMDARWLLNLAAMTLGRYPDGVPEQYRFDPAGFAKVNGFPHFDNIAGALGVDTFSLSGGAIADDFDGDGMIDLMVSTWDTAGQLMYFHNDGRGGFADWTERAGLLGLFGGLNMIHADYDNDGDIDVYVMRGAWLGAEGMHPNSLLRNDKGHFTDVTIAVGMGNNHYPTQTASWGDYDLDGDLDLFVGNETNGGVTAPCQLWRNEGDGSFIDVAVQAGVTSMGFSKSVIWGDYDNDRYPDLYVSNNNSTNRLFHNQGDGTFVDVAGKLSVDKPTGSFPSWFWDVNNDGNLDIFASSYSIGIGNLAASYSGLPSLKSAVPHLYIADGNGSFSSLGVEFGLLRPSLPMGANFGDLDGDGYLDFALGTGNPDFKTLMPNIMYMNRGGRAFMDVSTAAGFSHLQKGHAIAFADFDNDGDMDVFEQLGGAFRGDRFRDALYRNPGFGNHWLRVHLVGTRSNRSGIGARLHAVLRRGQKTLSTYKHVNSGGTFGGNPLRQTLGLGRAESVDRLEVYWPVSGLTQVITGLPMDSSVRITEGQPGFELLQPKTVTMGPM